jgi:hypothetical protein
LRGVPSALRPSHPANDRRNEAPDPREEGRGLLVHGPEGVSTVGPQASGGVVRAPSATRQPAPTRVTSSGRPSALAPLQQPPPPRGVGVRRRGPKATSRLSSSGRAALHGFDVDAVGASSWRRCAGTSGARVGASRVSPRLATCRRAVSLDPMKSARMCGGEALPTVHLEVHMLRQRTAADLTWQRKNPRSRRRIGHRAIDFDVPVVVVNHRGLL